MRTTWAIATALTVAASAPAPSAVAGTKTTSTWAAPDIEGQTYSKVVVLAKFSDESAKRILEDKTVEAIAAYQVLLPEDLASDEAIEAKAEPLGADAGIVFTVTGESTAVKSVSHVHAGPFSPFRGTSVPLDRSLRGGAWSPSVLDTREHTRVHPFRFLPLAHRPESG